MNKKHKRLKKQLRKESLLTSKDEMDILHEFEGLLNEDRPRAIWRRLALLKD
jgi:hypothetical protein